MVSVSLDLTLQVWDTVNGVHLDTFRETSGFVYSENIARSVAYLLDAQRSSLSQSIAKLIASGKAGQCLDYIVDSDGWLCSIYPLQRICWVPVSCRPEQLAFSGNIIALGTGDGRVVILDLQQLEHTCKL
jgi:hypothetical protein